MVVRLLSGVQHFVDQWTAACQDSLSFTISQGLLELKSIESVMTSNHLLICLPLLLLPSILSSIRAFPNESALHSRCPKYWSFSFSISPSNESSCCPRTLKSLFHQHNLKVSILQQSTVFSMFQFSHAYMITGKTIALTIWTFVSKAMSLLFNMLSRFVIVFVPRSIIYDNQLYRTYCKESEKEYVYVYAWHHFAVHLKLTQYCKLTVLQCKR